MLLVFAEDILISDCPFKLFVNLSAIKQKIMDIEFDAAAAPSNRPTKKISPEEDKRYKQLLHKFQQEL